MVVAMITPLDPRDQASADAINAMAHWYADQAQKVQWDAMVYGMGYWEELPNGMRRHIPWAEVHPTRQEAELADYRGREQAIRRVWGKLGGAW